MVTDGLVPADTAITALTEGMHQRFGGLMEKQSRTLGGIFSNLKDNVTLGLAKAMTPVTEELKYLMPGAIRTTGVAMDWLSQTMGRLVAKEQQWRKDGTFTRLWERAKEVSSDVASVWRNSLWPAVKDLTSALGGKEGLLAPLGAALGILSWMADHPDAAKAIFEGAAIAITSWKLAGLIQGVAMAMWGLNAAIRANPFGIAAAAAIALVLAMDRLFTKLNPGVSFFERLTAVASPLVFSLLNIGHHLDDILKKLGLVDKKKPVAMGPWAPGQSPNEKIEKGLPKIYPGQAAGGITTRSGASWVGEHGPELITLPRGARVDPLPQDHELPSFGPQIVVNVSGADVLHAQRVADVVVERIQDKLART
jgi:hypothetical protein